jgi:hypothetical protein
MVASKHQEKVGIRKRIEDDKFEALEAATSNIRQRTNKAMKRNIKL